MLFSNGIALKALYEFVILVYTLFLGFFGRFREQFLMFWRVKAFRHILFYSLSFVLFYNIHAVLSHKCHDIQFMCESESFNYKAQACL